MPLRRVCVLVVLLAVAASCAPRSRQDELRARAQESCAFTETTSADLPAWTKVEVNALPPPAALDVLRPTPDERVEAPLAPPPPPRPAPAWVPESACLTIVDR
jgi:hypothetical protein